MVLFFDTETTGLPSQIIDGKKTWLEFNHPNYPHIVQLGWANYKDNGELINEQAFIVKPEKFTIQPGDFIARMGIPQERAEFEGVPITTVLRAFVADLKFADTVVCHNFTFDRDMLKAALFREKMLSHWTYWEKNEETKSVCTKESSTDYCAIPFDDSVRRGYYGPNWIEQKYKWPKLEELHMFLFGAGFDGAHDAGADVRATAKCYFELKHRGVI